MKKKTGFMPKFIFFIFLVFCLFSVISLRLQLSDLETERDAAMAKLDDCKFRLEELDYEYSLDEDAYIERYMRKNGYRMGGEIVFKSED